MSDEFPIDQRAQNYRGYRAAGLRLTEDLVSEISSLHRQRESVGTVALHAFDKAHVVMLTERGLLSMAHSAQILSELRALEGGDLVANRRSAGGGLHAGETHLIRVLGEEVGGRIHVGRSSGDLTSVSVRMAQRERILTVIGAVNELRDRILDLAPFHWESVMPTYSHGQHAQPSTFGHVLLAWETALRRDFERLASLYSRVNRSPAGSVIGTGSEFEIDRCRTATLLGFESVAVNTFDAIFAEDLTIECASTLTILLSNLARWSDDLLLWSGQEHSIVDFPDRFCGTSSIMPHKKNPYPPQEIKGCLSSALGSLVTCFAVEKGPTGLPIADRFFAYEGVWSAFEQANRSLRLMSLVIPSIAVDVNRMYDLAARYWGTASDLAGEIVRQTGTPWRTAHQIVAILVRQAVSEGRSPLDTNTTHLDRAAMEYMGRPIGLSESALRDGLDPRLAVRRRRSVGGPGPAEAAEQSTEMAAALRRDQLWLGERHSELDRAANELELAIDRITGTHRGSK